MLNEDLVIHPSHYNHTDRKECWDEMREIFGDMAVAIFDVLSAYKYQYRAGTKDDNSDEQDRAKITNYMHHSADLLACANNQSIKSEGGALATRCYVRMKKELSKNG